MKDFIYHVPTKIYFGRTALDHLGETLKSFGDRVLLIYGGGSIKKSGLYDRILAESRKYHLELTELPGIDPNPRIQSVRKGAALCKEKKIQVVLAAGGGSCLDTGKFTAAGACVDFDPWEFLARKAPLTEALPLVTIPTIAATGSEMDDGGVISNLETQEKLARFAPALQPKVSFLDPELTYSVSRYQTACGSADILSHILETYFNPVEGMYMLDAVMEGLMKTVLKYAPIALEQPDDYEARANLLWTSTWAINGFIKGCQPQVWSCNAKQNELSVISDITNGLGLVILTHRLLEYCLDQEHVDRYVRLGVNVFGLDPAGEPMAIARESIQKLSAFFYGTLGLPSSLTELGIHPEDFPIMAEKACRTKGGIVRGFKDLQEADLVKIYEMCR